MLVELENFEDFQQQSMAESITTEEDNQHNDTSNTNKPTLKPLLSALRTPTQIFEEESTDDNIEDDDRSNNAIKRTVSFVPVCCI